MNNAHRFASAVAALALVAGVVALGRDSAVGAASDPPGGGAQALPVEVLVLASSDRYPVRESHVGRVVSRRDSQLGFERAGRLDRVLRDEGDRVEAGEILAELDTRALRAERLELEAQRDEIAARLSLARVTTERRRALRASDHLSPQGLDEAVFEERALAARLAAAQAAIHRLDVALDLSVIHAPYAGSIAARHVDEGTVVSPGQTVLQLIEESALEVRIGVPPATAHAIDVGSRHWIEADGDRFEGVLEAVLETVDPDSRTVTAIFRVEDPPAGLRSGTLARVALVHEVIGRGFWVPLAALTESRRGLWSAYVAAPGDDGASPRVDPRQVDVIHVESDRAFVRGTLNDGDRLIATGLHRLVPGQLVRVVEAREGFSASRMALQ